MVEYKYLPLIPGQTEPPKTGYATWQKPVQPVVRHMPITPPLPSPAAQARLVGEMAAELGRLRNEVAACHAAVVQRDELVKEVGRLKQMVGEVQKFRPAS
jgi:hypothetical protein